MPSMRQVRARIRVAKNIQQITKAMKMVAAARLKRAQDRVQSARPYAEQMRTVMGSLANAAGTSVAHPLLEQRASIKRMAFAIGTNGPREKAELTLGLTGLRAFFGERLFCAPEVGSFKPEPGLFLHAAAALGCAPPACAVVEDSLPGLRAGLAAGMQVFSLHPPAGLPQDVASQVHFIDGLATLQAWLA